MDTLFRKRGSASRSRISLNEDVYETPASPTEPLKASAYSDAPPGQVPNSGPSKSSSYGPATPNSRSRTSQGRESSASLDKQRISAPNTNTGLRHDEEGSGTAEIIFTDEPAGVDAGGFVIGGNKLPRTQTMSTFGSVGSGSVRRQTSIASRLEVLPESGSAHLTSPPGASGAPPFPALAQPPSITRRGSSGSIQSMDTTPQQGLSMRHRYPVYNPSSSPMNSTTSIPATYRSDRPLLERNEASDSASIRSARSGHGYPVKRAGPESDRFWVTQPPDEIIEEAFKRLMEQRMDDSRQVAGKSGVAGASSPRKEGHASLSSSRGATPNNGAGTPQSQVEEFPFSLPGPVAQPQDRSNVADDIRLDLERKKAEMSSWPISRKWPLVEADLRQAWDRERKRYLQQRDDSHRQGASTTKESSTRKMFNKAMGRLGGTGGGSATGEERKGFSRNSKDMATKLPDTGEAYVRLLSTMTCGVKDFQKLFQFLKSEEKDKLREFVNMGGTKWLCAYLTQCSHQLQRAALDLVNKEKNIALEQTILQCYDRLLRSGDGVREACENPEMVIRPIIQVLSSPSLGNSEEAAVILSVLAMRVPIGNEAVYREFELAPRGKKASLDSGRFSQWFASLSQQLSERGRLGTMVGAGQSARDINQIEKKGEGAFTSYCRGHLMFINILLCFEDRKGDPFPALPVRISRRMEMQRCGLSNVIGKLSTFQSQDAQLEEELEKFHDREAIDQEEEIMDQDRQILQDLDDPVELCQTIVTQLGDSRARNFFLSSLRQTLLMTTKRDPDQRIRYFQIINELVQGIVLNQEPGYDRDITDLMNIPIQRVFGRYEEADKVEQAERQIQERNLQILRLERERDKLKSELDGVEGGLINQLKREKLDLEGKLRTSRGVSEGLQHDLNKLKKEYEERIHDLEATVDELERRIMELLAMLKQSQDLDDIIKQKSSHGYNRKELFAELEKESDRYYARQQLEGRTGPGIAASRRIASMRLLSSREATRALDSQSSDSEADDGEEKSEDQREVEEDAFEDADAESGHIMVADRAALAQGQKRALQQKNKGRTEVVSTSQFVDAEDDKVRAHEARAMLASGESASPLNRNKGALPRSARSRHFPGDTHTSPIGRAGRLGPPIGSKSPARYGNIGRDHGYSSIMTELGKYQNGIRRSASAPANIDDDADTSSNISESRNSGFSVLTQGTAATSAGMSRQHSKESQVASISEQLASKIKAMNKAKSLDSDTSPTPKMLPTLTEDKEMADDNMLHDGRSSPPPPPPPPAPPMPAYLMGTLTDDDIPPPPPPPPPPPGIVFSGATDASSSSPPGPPRPAFLAGITSGMKLRRAGSSTNNDLMPPPPPPIMRRSSKRYSKAQFPLPDKRKEVAFKASKKMKTLQWEKVGQGKLDKTLWARPDEEQAQEEVAEKLKMVDVWSEMEDEFKAREAAMDAVSKRHKEELKSVLDPSVRKRVEILMARTKGIEPEEMCDRIVAFDKQLCDHTFLSELGPVLPTPQQVSLLKQQSAETPEELSLIHPADRLMIRLIQIPHLADRLKGMLYMINFEETSTLMEGASAVDLLQTACDDLRNANKFKDLLNVILMMGNFMNGSNYGGGAYGFKIGSINRLVDTKSSNGMNLLHFLERTISQHFPDILEFRSELEKPAEAYRVSYEDISLGTKELQIGLAKIKRDLEDRFGDISDGYVRRMYPFATDSEERILALKDRVLAAGRSFNEVKMYYGEGDDRFDPTSETEVFGRPTSLEFFGVFKTFVTSWDLCRAQNRAREDARLATEKRQLAERSRTQALSPQVTGASDQSSIMDDLHARLRMHGTPRAKRHERRRADLPRAPTFGSLDLGDMSLDAYATATRNLLKDLRLDGGDVEDTTEIPTYRRAGRRSNPPQALTDELFLMAAQGMETPTRETPQVEEEMDEEIEQPERMRATQESKKHIASGTPNQPDMLGLVMSGNQSAAAADTKSAEGASVPISDESNNDS
ncbi:hypothetical protein QFC22_005034 [Naganishia vaughanmartiniae]|uniref:Uncharacterized protein n=1 Tax=Naganishia vaughanmartiniae TaxID=1424756 RepID=A0ACC2WXL8_9TREE|nr:hypothetical protein QFC22_005034 [Naganishia vaughanmartiniae]